MALKVTTTHVRHAAHYPGAPANAPQGHDLLVISIYSRTMPPAFELAAEDYPKARFSCGGRDKDGQFWVFQQVLPFSEGRCERCPS